MTTTAKIGITLIIVLALVLIGWFAYFSSNDSDEEILPPADSTIVEQSPTPSPVAKDSLSGLGLSNKDDLSVEALESDLKVFDQQILNLNSDAKKIDESLNEVIN